MKRKKANIYMNAAIAVAIPAVLLWTLTARHSTPEPQKPSPSTAQRRTPKHSASAASSALSEPAAAAPRAALQRFESVRLPAHPSSPASEPDVVPDSADDQPFEAQETKNVETAPVADIPPRASREVIPEFDPEAELGAERAAYYREQEALAFRQYDEEEDKSEIEIVSNQLNMSSQQEQASNLIYEEARTALAQQQNTLRKLGRDMKAEERLAAYEKLAQFRNQFIYDRMKSVLSPDQLPFYRDSVAQVGEQKKPTTE